MRPLRYLLGIALLAACAKEKPAATPALPPPPPPAPAPINLADVAGNWTFKVMPEASDSVLTTYTAHATAADTGWTMTLPKRKPIALKITASGDSILMTTPVFESVLRKNVKVFTQGALHLVGGKLVGTTTAHYTTTKPDSVVHLRFEGTKAP